MGGTVNFQPKKRKLFKELVQGEKVKGSSRRCHIPGFWFSGRTTALRNVFCLDGSVGGTGCSSRLKQRLLKQKRYKRMWLASKQHRQDLDDTKANHPGNDRADPSQTNDLCDTLFTYIQFELPHDPR